MIPDYDVVIIGGSVAGRYAALSATQLKAKVALIEPIVSYGLIHHHALREIGELSKSLSNAAQFGLHANSADTSTDSTRVMQKGSSDESQPPTEKCPVSIEWQQAKLWTTGVVSNLQEQYSPVILAAKGVDIIFSSGQFQSSPLAFAVNDRILSARSYLLATSVQANPEIEGLRKTGFITLSNIWQSLCSPQPPKSWVIIGGVPQSIELAQTLVRLGSKVTLIVDRPLILSHVDPEMAQLLCSQLEAEGVRVLTQTRVTQVRRIHDKKWLQVGDKAIETDEIVVAIAQQPNIESLNLAAVGVKWNQHRILVNDKLQTSNHRIYACGDVIGGYDCPNIAYYEAKIALQNALFIPRFKVNYQYVPWAVLTQPTLAQVGLTEVQSKRRYSHNEVIVLRQFFKTLAAAQLRDETTGICKLIVLRNGEILGATILGAEARELINIMALAIAQKIKVHHLATLSFVSPSFSEIIEQTAREFRFPTS